MRISEDEFINSTKMGFLKNVFFRNKMAYKILYRAGISFNTRLFEVSYGTIIAYI